MESLPFCLQATGLIYIWLLLVGFLAGLLVCLAILLWDEAGTKDEAWQYAAHRQDALLTQSTDCSPAPLGKWDEIPQETPGAASRVPGAFLSDGKTSRKDRIFFTL